ncbi:hypothetical protein RND81_12G197900 [Saponaria officinalis]|uniref:MULE transposase domain-containing protein n=1 Tax=Saponaria officinalis TaxID=3572 RepID=A0AAW1HD16_SAPOF
MMLNDRAGIPMTRNFNTLVLEGGGYENIPFNYRDMRNAINQERCKGRFQGDAHELISYFDILKRENPEFYFAIQKDVNGALLNIFWADARCRAMYKAFSDPVSYDMTFLSNRYLMPFSHFVGVNHHGSTVIFASALVSYKDTETFEWVFERWIECMGRAPTVMLTDQCKAMEGAIRKVFPHTKHRLCLWHILQNADKNLRSHPQFTAIDRDMRTLVHESTTEHEFKNMWAEMVESIETGLKQFIDQYEFALKRKAEEENVLNFADKNRPLKWDQGILFEDDFHKVYTNKKFQEVKDEVYGCINTNVETLLNILGPVKMFRATSKGIVCRHIIKCLDVLGVKVIPEKYILARWRKDLVRGYENIRVGYYDPGQSERVKRSVELMVRSDYMTTLAMHDDEAYHIYMTKTSELIKTLEAHAGIENVDEFGEGRAEQKIRLSEPIRSDIRSVSDPKKQISDPKKPIESDIRSDNFGYRIGYRYQFSECRISDPIRTQN